MANIITPRARLSFPNLFTARVNDQSDDKTPKFSCTLLFDEAARATPEWKAMQAAAAEAAVEKFGDKAKTLKLRSPFRDGSEKTLEGYEGTVFINCSSKMKPGVIGPNKAPITDEMDIYPGCFVRVSLSAYGYDAKGNKGVSFGLRNVQKVGDGESLGGRSRAEDDFDAVEESAAEAGAGFDNMFG